MIRLFCLLIIIARFSLRSGAEGLVVFRPVRSSCSALHSSAGIALTIPAGTHDFGEMVGFDFRRNDQTKANKVRFERNRFK